MKTAGTSRLPRDKKIPVAGSWALRPAQHTIAVLVGPAVACFAILIAPGPVRSFPGNQP